MPSDHHVAAVAVEIPVMIVLENVVQDASTSTLFSDGFVFFSTIEMLFRSQSRDRSESNDSGSHREKKHSKRRRTKSKSPSKKKSSRSKRHSSRSESKGKDDDRSSNHSKDGTPSPKRDGTDDNESDRQVNKNLTVSLHSCLSFLEINTSQI